MKKIADDNLSPRAKHIANIYDGKKNLDNPWAREVVHDGSDVVK